VSWKQSGSGEYKTRTEWHRVISWNKLGEWAGALQKGAYVEVEGELRYRKFTPAESERSVRVAEIYANSILALDRSERQPFHRSSPVGRSSFAKDRRERLE
jgi:single-strand DNA-binding protein